MRGRAFLHHSLLVIVLSTLGPGLVQAEPKPLTSRTCETLLLLPHPTSVLARQPEPTTGPDDRPDGWDELSAVQVLRSERDGKAFFCVAVALAPRLLVTAAHCLEGVNAAALATAPDVRMARAILHPGYDPKRSFYADDLGLVILDAPVPGHPRFLSVYDPLRDGEPDPGQRLERIGLGSGEHGTLRWTDPSFDHLETPGTNPDGGYAMVMKDALAFSGDSGGPLLARIDGRYRILAIHSTYDPPKGVTYEPLLAPAARWISRAAAQALVATAPAPKSQPNPVH